MFEGDNPGKPGELKPARRPGALGPVHYFLACLSFIPFFGVPVGIVSIIFGSIKMGQGGGRILAIGAGGLVVTILSAYFGVAMGYKYFMKSEWVRSSMLEVSKENLDTLALAIENYKIEEGGYPDSLAELDDDTTTSRFDPLHIFGKPDEEPTPEYAYRKEGETYTVYSLGWDLVDGTADDFHPSDSIAANCEGYRRPEHMGRDSVAK